jgi:nitroreductase
MQFVIMLAFGIADEPLHRASMGEFKREPLGKMTAVQGREDLLEAARLAPSGMNNQPWYFTGSDGTIDVHSSKSLIAANMNQISAGIALCHLWLASKHLGMRPEMFRDPGRMGRAPKGYAYVASARLPS